MSNAANPLPNAPAGFAIELASRIDWIAGNAGTATSSTVCLAGLAETLAKGIADYAAQASKGTGATWTKVDDLQDAVEHLARAAATLQLINGMTCESLQG